MALHDSDHLNAFEDGTPLSQDPGGSRNPTPGHAASDLVKCFGRDETTLVAAEYSDFRTSRSVRYVANVFHLLCAQIALPYRHLTPCIKRFGHRSVPMGSNQWCNDDMTSFGRGDFLDMHFVPASPIEN
jgi:hypothetical protein